MEKKINTQNIVSLLQLPKIGRKTALKLLTALDHKISDREDFTNFVKEQAIKHKLPDYSAQDLENAFTKTEQIFEQSENLGIKIISFLDDDYPQQLRQTPDFPITLSYKGNISVLSEKPNVAVIGTREPTDYGLKIGQRLGEVFATFEFNVVSGLAIGCDTAGHLGALKGNGTTTAVLAHGLDFIYPKENRELAEMIIDKNGALISEYFVKQKPMANFFVERDRIQAGLSQSVVIVETDVKGGTMHTAKYCAEYDRKLVCFNHPQEYRNQPKAQGNQMLIKEGKALPVYSKDEMDILVFILINDFTESKCKYETDVRDRDYFNIVETLYESNRTYLHNRVCEKYFSAVEFKSNFNDLKYHIRGYLDFQNSSDILSWARNFAYHKTDKECIRTFPKSDNKMYLELYRLLCLHAQESSSNNEDTSNTESDSKEIKDEGKQKGLWE